ncbi:TIGR03943 family putative permease subunit [Kallotenue papyrolyticum]|uniref:TIGR03943 family putative permease subunit n=1 Tax=Kallotenue papyrolyticum TaxID=1325125 RepID=UPI000492765F|nr:TIGR03943 family protein [Kallotenue papyrolyticum]
MSERILWLLFDTYRARKQGRAAITQRQRARLAELVAFARAHSPDEVNGKAVDVVGFVYQDPERPAGEFHVVRYVMSCCVADRAGVSLPVRWKEAAALPNDRWVRVTGTIETRQTPTGAQELVVLAEKVETVPQPREPYLYP